MPLPAGTRLGPYELLAPLGAGGMGEVYRARDTRLGREVAVKTLPAAFADDGERRARFEAEAGAIAALSHPNVLALHDIGIAEGVPYLVMELLEGQTLRERLEDGPLSAARTLALGAQVAHGLAAAHDKGIVHRDLKPENIVLATDGRARILDFGLARREQAAATGSQSLAPTVALLTEPGTLMGTHGYMAPEQVRGNPADARSDLFALGAVLFEMLTARRAFQAETAADTMSAILREDPPELLRLAPDTPPALDRIVRRCLEKLPAARFRSAADLAFALEAVALSSSATHAAAVDGGSQRADVRFQRITYRSGAILGARFAPGGTGVVFAAAWEGRACEVFIAQPGNPEARSLGLPTANLLSISPQGEMALSLEATHFFWNEVRGVLARGSLAGGGIRPVLEGVGHAAWAPDGRGLAITRYAKERCRIEYPSGHLLVETTDWIGSVSVSRDGRRVAYSRHTYPGDSAGDLLVTDAQGETRALASGMSSITGVEWSPTGDEVWFSGVDERLRHGLWAVGLSGTRRDLFASPTRIVLRDVSPDGRALVSFGSMRLGLCVQRGDAPPVDCSWFDGSVAAGLTEDGQRVLFWEAHEAESPHFATYLRAIDGSAAVRLGEGGGTGLSADGAWVVAVTHPYRDELLLHPTGFGESRTIRIPGGARAEWACFHPDGRRLFVVTSSPERPRRLHLLTLASGEMELLWDEPVTFEPIRGLPVSVDGDWLVLRREDGGAVLFSCRERSSQPLAELGREDIPLAFDRSGESLFVTRLERSGRRIERLDLQTGARTHWRDVAPPDRSGVYFVGAPVITRDGETMAFSYLRALDELHLVLGLA